MTPEDVVRRFWEAQTVGDRETARSCMSPDVRWTVVGRTHPVAREFVGHEGFFGELLGILGAKLRGARLSVTHVVAAGDQVVTEFHQTAQAVNGHAFDIDIITVMTVDQGLITECREYMDLAEVADAFGAD